MSLKMPHSLDVEQLFLGCMLNKDDTAKEAIEAFEKDLFYDLKHQELFLNIKQVVKKNDTVDTTLLLEEMRKEEGGFSKDDIVFVTDIAQKSPTSTFFEEYAKTLKDLSRRRRVIKDLSLVSKTLQDGKGETDKLLDKIMKMVTSMEQEESGLRSLGEIISAEKIVEELSEKQKHYAKTGRRKVSKNVVNTGIPEIDNTLGGLHPTRVYVLGARPGSGKTALALNISLFAARQGHGVALFSLEMSEKELTNRYVSSHSEKKLQDIQMGSLTPKDFEDVEEKFLEIKTLPIEIDGGSLTSKRLRTEIRKGKRQRNIHLVVIDYLQLMTCENQDKKNSRYLEISEISRSLKLLAKEFKVAILCLSQLNRKSEEREGKDPQLSDLRDSGAIEQDADVVMLLSGNGNKSKLKVAKNRHGMVGSIPLNFRGDIVKFTGRGW
jgi:replicative DNA helicase